MSNGQGALSARQALVRQVPAFLVVGGLAFCVDVGLTVTLASGGLSPYLARPPAVVVATLVAFALNRAFTFGGRGRWPRELARYVLVAAGGQALNYAVYACALVAGHRLGFANSAALVGACVACGSGAAMLLTFAGFRQFAFRA